MNIMNISKVHNKNELTILAVIDCMKVKWHSLYIYNNCSGRFIYNYFKDYYNKPITVEIDVDGKRSILKSISNLNNYIKKNPDRICVYIYFDD
tara:strand:- start:53 stop:331 length:279 start_codon:yes stop_codon:yes gene_type:complete